MKKLSKNISPNLQEIVLVDKEYPKQLIADIYSAKKSIDMETYIFSIDTLGKSIAESLIDASKRGVKVRLLVDGVGTFNWKNSMSQSMEAAGIVTKVYHPIFFFFRQWTPTSSFFKKILHLVTHINSRNHRKTCLIDNQIAYIGSANITDCVYVEYKKMEWHDITVRLTGLSLNKLQHAFDKAWDCNLFKMHIKNYFTKIEPDPIFYLNDSWRKRRSIYKNLLKKIKHSKNRIWITNAYFIPKYFFLKKLAHAAKRGVDVRILIPGNTDVIGISILMKYCYSSLLKSGVTIMKYSDGILHTKFLIIDDWFCVGTSNLNYRSLKRDLEVDVKIQTKSAQQTLENYFKKLYDQSGKIRKKDATLSFLEKIAFNFLWLIRSWF